MSSFPEPQFQPEPDKHDDSGAPSDVVCAPAAWFDAWLMTAGTHDEATVLAGCMRLYRQVDELLVVDEADLLSSELLLEAIGSTEAQTATSKILKALNRAVRRGALTRSWTGDGETARTRYLLNMGPPSEAATAQSERQPAVVKRYDSTGPAVFAAYEDAIGLLTPLIADQIQQSLDRYPADQILDAIRESVRTNRRSWRNIQRILQNWSDSGRELALEIEVTTHEEDKRRDQEHLDPDQYRGERHLDRARRLQVRDL